MTNINKLFTKLVFVGKKTNDMSRFGSNSDHIGEAGLLPDLITGVS